MTAADGRFDAAVTGIGMVTPAGLGTAASWECVKVADGTAAQRVPALAGIPADIGCWIPDFDPAAAVGKRKAWRLDRSSQFALAAAAEALADAGLDPADWDGARVGVVLGSGIGGAASWEKQHHVLLEQGSEKVSALLIPMLAVNMSAGYIAMEFGARGPNFVTATACASGATAVGAARELLRSGRCDVVITGGTEACLIPSIISGFQQMGALSGRRDEPAAASRPFDVDRDGFVLGEGAGVLVLESAEHARARGARVYGKLAGTGITSDAYHITGNHPEGIGQTNAMTQAIRQAGLTPADIGHVNAHATSTVVGDIGEAVAIRKAVGDHVVLTAPKASFGHLVGGAGAVESIITLLSIYHGIIPATRNLENQDPKVELDIVSGEARKLELTAAMNDSFGFGGHNVALVFMA
jgi:3-oxoacyl-[acyl-carrier-protein] synthase II